MGVLAVLAIGSGAGPARHSPEGRGGPRPRPLARRPDRPHHPGAAGLPGPDAPAGQRPVAGPGRGAQPALRRKGLLLDAGHGGPGNRSARRRAGVTLEPVRAKDGHITLHLRVVGPRDRAVDLVRNLEHSKRFLLPRIVGENSESTGGPGQRLEPVSASNRFDFDLLAEYNPPAPEERKAWPRSSEKTARRAGKARQRQASAAASRSLSAGSGRAPATARHGRPYTGRRRPTPEPKPRRPAMSTPHALPWRERLTSPLTWHYAGFAVLLVAGHRALRPPGPGLGRHQRPLHRRAGRQAG